LEAGVFKAKLVDLTTEDGQYGPQAKFVFELDGVRAEDGSPGRLWAWSSFKLTPATKLHRWVQALGGERPVPKTQYNLSKLMGARCRVLVEIKDTDDGPRPRVHEVLPVVKVAKPTATGDACSECGEAVEVYDADGTAYCAGHAPQGE
jgi:hypothetical protein